METHHVLEINLISAQDLKSSSRRSKTYAVAWIDPKKKLRTRVDSVGGENPTWNDKFLFRVTPEFLASETSGISVEIYAVGYLIDTLIGSVRFLTSSLISAGFASSADAGGGMITPYFTAFQIRRPSGRFHGVLNVGAMVIDGSGLAAAMKNDDVSAVGFHDLMMKRGKPPRRRNSSRMRKPLSMSDLTDYENVVRMTRGGYAGSEPGDLSDGCESTTSSSSNASTALKEWNGNIINNNNHNRSASDGGGVMTSCLINPRKHSFTPSDLSLDEEETTLDDESKENKVSLNRRP